MQISEEVIKVLEYLGSKFGIAIDWTSQNVIPYVEQLCEKFIHWEISTSYAWIFIMIALTLIFFTTTNLLIKWGVMDAGIWGFFAAFLVIALVVCGAQVFDIIECKTFPEKALYDYISFHLEN